MELSAELSLYPLTGDVDTSVLAFIDDLHASGQISVQRKVPYQQISFRVLALIVEGNAIGPRLAVLVVGLQNITLTRIIAETAKTSGVVRFVR